MFGVMLRGCLSGLFAALLTALPVERAMAGAADLRGEIDGAPYHMRVPENWNGDVIVFANMYRPLAMRPGQVEDRSVLIAPYAIDDQGKPYNMEEALLARGFALAGTAYRKNGFVVAEGTQDILALVRQFEKTVSQPKHAIFYGCGLGAVIGAKIAEMPDSPFDGSIQVGFTGGGFPVELDRFLAMALAYDVAFGFKRDWGMISANDGNIKRSCVSCDAAGKDCHGPETPFTGLDFASQVAATIQPQFSDPRFEFIRRVNRMPLEGYYTPVNDPHQSSLPWSVLTSLVMTQAMSEIECQAGGVPWQNQGHVYTLTAQDQAELTAKGVPWQAYLADMNRRTVFKADARARDYMVKNFEPTGKLTRPVLTVKSLTDGLDRPWHDGLYKTAVDRHGQSGDLVQTFVGETTHCALSTSQTMAVIDAMTGWLKPGHHAPKPANFPASIGFVPDFKPPPPPYEGQ